METINELRASPRIPASTRVQVMASGRRKLYAMVINISMGGVLLQAAPSLPVGSSCNMAISLPDGKHGAKVLAEGKVIRSDSQGTAIQFAHALEAKTYQVFANPTMALAGASLIDSYINYFRVSQSENFADSEKLLGVTRRDFQIVFLITFLVCIPLAVLPVWAFRASLPSAPNWAKITASFAYAAVWFGVVQPSLDLAVFRVLRHRKTLTR